MKQSAISCPAHKQQYRKRAEALRAARAMEGPHTATRCNRCKQWFVVPAKA